MDWATNPENGTVHYAYTACGLLASKTDAKGVVANYTYDAYHRLTRINCTGTSAGGYDKNFTYDTYSPDPGANIYGRLAAITWTPPAVTFDNGDTQSNAYTQVFGYTSYGAVTRSKLKAAATYTPYGGNPSTAQTSMEADFTWTMQGEEASVTYPSGRYVYNKFDSLGRSNGMHHTLNTPAGDNYPAGLDADMVNAVTYRIGGRMEQMDFKTGAWDYPSPVIGLVSRRQVRIPNEEA